MTPAQAWTETMPTVKNPDSSGRGLEERTNVKRAIDTISAAALKGSLMSIAQRRDFVLDRLIVEATDAGDSARLRALELLGKTASLFLDRAEVTVTSADDIKSRIESMLQSVRERDERVIDHDDGGDCVNNADTVDADTVDAHDNDAHVNHVVDHVVPRDASSVNGEQHVDSTGENNHSGDDFRPAETPPPPHPPRTDSA